MNSITRKLRLDENPRAVGSTPSSSLDGVLLQIKGPKTVSTVAKSSMDWDNFKEKEGIEDVVANAAKEG